ncbi:hypothetical protein [Bordetella genomosp. 13]|uniref:hypothetical protein n=1 Tax=Bordetella genomosp. 13 TaxID=463040 RepID=UPI0011A2B2E1|nr:hypothetical protein [Bordetella genomosp. 13]
MPDTNEMSAARPFTRHADLPRPDHIGLALTWGARGAGGQPGTLNNITRGGVGAPDNAMAMR